MFQRVFKGEVFFRRVSLLRTLWDSSEQYLANYHNTYIHFKLELLVRAYFYESCVTRGVSAKVYPSQRIDTQDNCVAFLEFLVNGLVDDVRGNKWERADHPRFYAPHELYSLIQNKPNVRMSGSVGGGRGSTVIGTKLQGLSAGVPSPDPGRALTGHGTQPVVPACHKHGLCIWYLAGALGLRNRKNRLFACRDAGAKHALLKQVPLVDVHLLLSDKEFIRNGELHSQLVKAIDTNKGRFAK